MKRFIKLICISTALFSTAAVLWGQDDSQASLRENPDMTSDSTFIAARAIEYPSFINIEANRIEMNGADWGALAMTLKNVDSARVNIVHIGDSHLQADMATAVSRRRLGDRYGSAGRALIVPFKLAGTNEPVDYSIRTEVPVEQSRLLKTPWPTAMGFTGVAVRPQEKEFEINITAQESFDSIAVYYTGDSLCILNEGRTYSTPCVASIALSDTSSAINLKLASTKNVDIHGFNLLKGRKGLAYHVIGNNGATYATYNGLPGFSKDIAMLDPALIILSLGTNEAFGKTSDDEMKLQMRTLIDGLKASCPGTQFLLTTPAECQRRTYRGKGRKRRRTGYAVNSNVKRLRNVIIEFGRDEKIPVYDFYEIAGGDGSSSRWLRDGFMNKDRIHLLRPGYTLQGNLFTDAFENAIDIACKPVI